MPSALNVFGWIASPVTIRWVFAGVLLCILVAGLDPKGYRFRNEVTWNSQSPGLHFGRFGRVHTEPFITSEQASALNRDGFTLEVAASLANNLRGGYRFLAAFHAGDDNSQLVIGQWRGQIVVMNGDDYRHRRGVPRIAADTSKQTNGRVLVTITTGIQGTRIYLDGKEAGSMEDLRLIIPAGDRKGRLVIGNSVQAINPWIAEVFGFAAYSKVLNADQVARHYARWSDRRNFSFARVDDPFLLYAFDEGSGHEVRDQSGHGAPLEIPARLVALEQRAFAPLSRDIEHTGSLKTDVTVNLLGFIPFGFVLGIILSRSSRSRWKVFLLTTAAGFLLSFFIELAQAWMPSRDSSLLDLLMNTAGTVLGAAVAIVAAKFIRKVQVASNPAVD